MKTTSNLQQRPFIAILLLAIFVQFSANGQNNVNVSQPETVYANIAQGKTATASSSDNTDRTANNAFDGSVNTRFSSGYSDNQWLSVDLGKSYLISKVILSWEKSYGKDFDILFSNTGDFTDLFNDSIQVRNHVLSSNSVAGIDTLSTKSGTVARYVRMQGIHRATSNGYSIWEMQVLGAVSSAGLFPVSVTGLTVTPQTDYNLVEWKTVTEYSNAGFSIERSNDGVNFSQIAWLPARNAGSVISYYSFTDKQAGSGKNYYRLKQTWLDGKIGYSSILAINVAAGSSNLNTYPVPVTDHLVVEYKGETGDNISIALVNMSGLPVFNSKMTVHGSQQTMTINRTAGMIAGQYFLCISSANNKKYTQKIILQ